MYLEKIPDEELQKMPHTKAQKSNPQLRLEPTLHGWKGRKADMLTITPCIAPSAGHGTDFM